MKEPESTFPFNDSEMNHLSATMHKRMTNFHDEIWIRAFLYHNISGSSRLSMQCAPCYEKVYQFVWSEYNRIAKSKSKKNEE